MNVYLIKAQGGFIPADIPTEEWAKKIKYGEVVNADFKKVRNYQFLKKYFALLNVGFENWNPQALDTKHGVPEKNFEQFREDTIILAGYYYVTVRMDGSTRVRAKSISFANMEEEEFEKLYSATINVFLKHIYDNTMTREKIDYIVNQVMSFT
jgi:hypothetical protein